MNGKNLKKQSETDWARIDRMTDDEIDTSDIPPLDDAFCARAKWRLPRFYMDLNDLRAARRFATYILEQKLHQKRKSEPARSRQQLVHLAFNTSLITSYSRPFHHNKNLEGQPKSSLSKHTSDVLNEVEVEIHTRVLAMRDQAYAHSDARSHLLEGFDYTKFMELMRPVETLDQSTTCMLKIMIGKWMGYLEAGKSDLKESLRRRA